MPEIDPFAELAKAADALVRLVQENPKAADQLNPLIADLKDARSTFGPMLARVAPDPRNPADPRQFVLDFLKAHQIPDDAIAPLVKRLVKNKLASPTAPPPDYDNMDFWEGDWKTEKWPD